MQAGRYTEACPKLEQAVRLFPGAGLLLNLADCYEHTGRLASAWTRFGDAAAAGRRAGNADAEAEANRRRGLVEPNLTRVVVHVDKEEPGLAVTLDGQKLDRARWNTPIAVDPGLQRLDGAGAGLPALVVDADRRRRGEHRDRERAGAVAGRTGRGPRA